MTKAKRIPKEKKVKAVKDTSFYLMFGYNPTIAVRQRFHTFNHRTGSRVNNTIIVNPE
tara:strand:- start:627 stop:800 length:174 start_codon:yes stop_codon:yes gene_type:complete